MTPVFHLLPFSFLSISVLRAHPVRNLTLLFAIHSYSNPLNPYKFIQNKLYKSRLHVLATATAQVQSTRIGSACAMEHHSPICISNKRFRTTPVRLQKTPARLRRLASAQFRPEHAISAQICCALPTRRAPRTRPTRMLHALYSASRKAVVILPTIAGPTALEFPRPVRGIRTTACRSRPSHSGSEFETALGKKGQGRKKSRGRSRHGVGVDPIKDPCKPEWEILGIHRHENDVQTDTQSRNRDVRGPPDKGGQSC